MSILKVKSDKLPLIQRRRLFMPEDDERLKNIIQSDNFKGWKDIALKMKNFNARQCRDRWHHYLSPSIHNKPWENYEDQIIIRLVNLIGTRWAYISSFLPGRTDNAIKNRFNSVLRYVVSNPSYLNLSLNEAFSYIHNEREVVDEHKDSNGDDFILDKDFMEKFFEPIVKK